MAPDMSSGSLFHTIIEPFKIKSVEPFSAVFEPLSR